MIRIFRLLNTLNFDTALGAVSFVLLISYSQQITIEISIYYAIIISVLSIYNLDHLLDSSRLKEGSISFRHLFYQNYFKYLIIWQIVLALIGGVILFQLPTKILWYGIAMVLAMGAYFIAIFKKPQHNFLLREAIVALGYMLAVGVIPFAHTSVFSGLGYYELLSLVFLIGLSNIWVLAIYDAEIDKSQQHHSIANRVSDFKLAIIVKGLILLTCFLILVYTIWMQLWMIGLPLLIVEFTYLLLLLNQSYFKKNDIPRLLGEAILLLPGLIIIIYNAV